MLVMRLVRPPVFPHRGRRCGSTVRITITGKGTCGTTVSFGDGKTGRIPNRALPHKYTHRYKATGIKTIRVRATGAGCSVPKSGSPSTRIRILARTTKLPGVGKPPIRKIFPGKLQTRRLDPALTERQRNVLRGATAPVMCGGRRATIVGTSGNDNIVGTPGDDVIHGLGGNDAIRGGGGNDIICGGYGRDTLRGGPGNDMLYGGEGVDGCNGETGLDMGSITCVDTD